MAQSRPKRSTGNLEAAAGDLVYEIETMLFAARYLRDGYASPASPPEGRACDVSLESFLLHHRNLRAFLCPSLQRVYESDVLASDFLDMEEQADQGDPVVLGQDKDRLNALLAHISYDREKYRHAGDKEWDVLRMRDEMVQYLKVFLWKVVPVRRAWFLKSQFLAEELGIGLEGGPPASGCRADTERPPLSRVHWDDGIPR
jgi:hypothetical protein